MRFLTKTAAVAIVAMGLSTGMAHATVVSEIFTNYTCSAGTCTGSATTGSQATDLFATFNIPMFDTGLGTLTQIVISVSGSMNATGSVEVDGPTVTNVSLTEFSTITDDPPQPVAGSSSLMITTGSNGGDTNLRFTANASAMAALGTVPGPSFVGGITLDNAFTTLTLDQTSAFDGNLASLGGGTFAITFSSGEFTSLTSGPGFTTAGATVDDTINMSVTYDYTSATATPVPEPASLAIFGVGLAALGLMRCKRKVR